jgi:hypothetical protein
MPPAAPAPAAAAGPPRAAARAAAARLAASSAGGAPARPPAAAAAVGAICCICSCARRACSACTRASASLSPCCVYRAWSFCACSRVERLPPAAPNKLLPSIAAAASMSARWLVRRASSRYSATAISLSSCSRQNKEHGCVRKDEPMTPADPSWCWWTVNGSSSSMHIMYVYNGRCLEQASSVHARVCGCR